MATRLELPPIDTIYLDMDGPLVDDFGMFSGLDPTVKNMEDHITTLKIFGLKQTYLFPLIEEAIIKNRFLTAKPTKFVEVIKLILLPYWKSKGINVEILSSTMHTNPNRASLADQKIKWLKANGFEHLKANLVEGSLCKQEYARPGALLIDDYDRTIGQFIKAGGYAIQYTNLNEVMQKLRLIGLSTPT